MDKKDKLDPFANLGPPGIVRRFREETMPRPVVEALAKVFTDTGKKLRAGQRLVDAAIEAGDIARGVAAPAHVHEAPKRKPGRPKSDKPKPWEGICSKTEWYRRRKAGKLDAL